MEIALSGTPTFANASNTVNAFGSSTNLFGPIMLVLWSVIVISVVSALRSNHYFQKLIDALGFVATSFTYFLHGLGTIAIFAGAMAPAYFLYTAEPGTQAMVGKIALGGLGAYALIAGIGYVGKEYLIDPIRGNLEDVWPEPPDDDERTEVAD